MSIDLQAEPESIVETPTRPRRWTRRSDGRRVGPGVVLVAIVAVFTVVPVLYVVVGSFNLADPGQPLSFGLEGWREALSEAKSVSSIGYSFLLSIRIPIAVLVAFVISWLLIRVEIPARRFIEYSLWFAFFLPVLPVTIGWLLLADPHYGALNKLFMQLPFVDGPLFNMYSVEGILWVHLTLTSIPIMVILLSPAMRRFDASYEEAASMSGVGAVRTLRRVTLPLLAPAVLTALLAGLIKSLEVFEVERILGTPVGIDVYATRIYDLVTWEPPRYAQGMALSTLFLVLLLLVALVYQRLSKRYGGNATVTGRAVRLQPRMRGRWSYVLSGILLSYLTVGVFLPLAVLIVGSFNTLFGFFDIADPWTTEHWTRTLRDPAFVRATINSLVLGVGAAGVGTILFALLAWVIVRSQIWGRTALSVLVWLPWSIPGLLLGIAFLSILVSTPGISVFYGTMVPLVVAMIVRELPIGVQMIRSSIEQVSGELEEAAAMSGARFFRTFYRVTLPLISPMCVSVFVLVFMATVRDIGTVVLLAAPGTRTLPLLLFEYASSARLEAAAVLGVLIAVVSLGVVSLAMRFGLKMR